MRILDIQNLQLSHNNFNISINDLNLENDVWYIEMSINLYFNFSYHSTRYYIRPIVADHINIHSVDTLRYIPANSVLANSKLECHCLVSYREGLGTSL